MEKKLYITFDHVKDDHFRHLVKKDVKIIIFDHIDAKDNYN